MRDATHMDEVERWARYVKEHPAEWKKEHTAFINAWCQKRLADHQSIDWWHERRQPYFEHAQYSTRIYSRCSGSRLTTREYTSGILTFEKARSAHEKILRMPGGEEKLRKLRKR